jgi:hypothetical protein
MDTDLENIQLPSFILAGLYKDSLVVLDEMQPAAKLLQTDEKQVVAAEEKALPLQEIAPVTIPITHQPQKFYLGDNRKQISILVRDATAVYLHDDSLNFLSSILGACKLNLGDVAIINHQHQPQQFASLKENLEPKFVLLFEVSPTDINLPFTIPYYQVQPYNNCSFLSAPSLQKMLGDSQEAKLEKSKLWLSLKKMFGI